ncbi:hypothetical protein OSW16_12625 [Pseudomonas putida]|uniref:imm11 family protein n=1 Tax=Pseudomonas putida TaxID=303 RepID=UPI00226E0D27|nr:DUF1629 domain-containing protein [Pseudomonas putida]WAC00441.1 hypothetical protein OSW16_12625 [Pseudomonas putida]
MKYFTMSHELVEGGYTDGDVLFSPGLEDYYQVGKSLPLDGISITVVLDKKVRSLKSDFFLTACGAFIGSKELRVVCEELGSDARFVKAEVKYFGGKSVEKDYFLIHLDAKIKCFDYEQSDYSGKNMVLRRLQSGELDAEYLARGVTKLCIDESKADGSHFLFLGDVAWIDPIVSEVFVSKVEDKKLATRFIALG